jgi:hypothetical protein
MGSRNVAQNLLALSAVELLHRPGCLYHQWSCGTELAGSITSGAVAKTWLILPPSVVNKQKLNRTQIKPLERTEPYTSKSQILLDVSWINS